MGMTNHLFVADANSISHWYSVILTTTQLDDYIPWLENVISGQWSYPRYKMIFFSNRDDAVLFELTWL